MTPNRWSLPVLVVVALALVLFVLRGLEHAPAPIVPAADRTSFSAERAYAHLRDLIGENVPHPAGSPAQREIGNRIIARLEALGLAPQVQEGLQCSTLAPGCSQVRNIIGMRQGSRDGPAMMITAHYDSVPGSAAAADDGAGVAAMLEIADLLAHREPLQHDVIFLFADAEESGLRGAMHFASQHPLMKRGAFIVNLEARGVSGPGAMFETGAGNEALIGLFGEVVPRPAANSLLFEVYRRMPNSTDFTIYSRAGVRGFNFAFSRGASLYHSERDDLAHLDLRSLQHQGESALAVLTGAGAVSLESLRSNRDASYVDVGTRALLAWPVNWNLPMALAALLLVAAIVCWRASLRAGQLVWALLAVGALLACLPLSGWLLSWPLGRWPGAHPLDHPYPWPGRIALIAMSLLVVLAIARWSGSRAGMRATLCVSWMLLGLLALALAFLMPGAAFLPLAPLIAFIVFVAATRTLLVAQIAGFVIAAWSGLYLFLLADVVLGFPSSHLKVLPLLLFALPLLPITMAWVDQGPARAATGMLSCVVLAAAAAGALVPTHTVDRPRGVNLVHLQEEGKAPAWVLESFGDPGREVRHAMGFRRPMQPYLRYGVKPEMAYLEPAPPVDAAAPILTIEQDTIRAGTRHVRAILQSRRDAFLMMLALPDHAPIDSVRIEGQPVIAGAVDEPRVIGLHGLGNAPVRVEMTARAGVPLTLVLLDVATLKGKAEAAQLLRARPADAAPLQFGDQSIALRRTSL